MEAAARPRDEPPRPLPLSDEAWLPVLGPFGWVERTWTMRTTDPAVAAFLAAAYEPMILPRPHDAEASAEQLSFLVPDDGRPGGVYRGTELLRSSHDPSQLLDDLVWSTVRVVVAASSERLMLHTAVVERDGSAVALVGPSGVGKSTLAAALVDRGFGYLTDEIAAIDADLVIQGFAKPLRIVRGAWELLGHLDPRGDEQLARYFERQWQLLPASLGSVVRSSRLGLVVFSRFAPGAGVSSSRLSPGTALGEAAKSIFTPRGQLVPATRLRDLAGVLRSVPCYLLEYGSVAEAMDRIGVWMSNS